MKSERPPAETIVDAGFDRIDRYAVANAEDADVTAEIEVVVLDLRTPVVPEGIFRSYANHPAAGSSPARIEWHAKHSAADGDIGPGPTPLAIDKPVIESVTEPRGQCPKRVPVEAGRKQRAERHKVVFYARP